MPDLRAVHDELCRRLSVHEDVFVLTHNATDANAATCRKVEAPDPDTYILLGAPTEKYPDGLMFAGVRLGTRSVSYHLMCTYLEPDMVADLSPELRRRMQGKSCFGFTRVDPDLFDELDRLTARGRELYAARGWTAR